MGKTEEGNRGRWGRMRNAETIHSITFRANSTVSLTTFVKLSDLPRANTGHDVLTILQESIYAPM